MTRQSLPRRQAGLSEQGVDLIAGSTPVLAQDPWGSSGSTESVESIELSLVASALWRARAWIIATALVGAVASYLASGLLTPRYEATAVLRLDGDGTDVLTDLRSEQRRPVEPVALATRAQSIASAEVLQQVASQAGLKYAPEFNPALSQEDPAQGGQNVDARMLAAIGEHVDVSLIEQSGLARITVKSADPVLASRTANAVGEVFIQQQIRSQRASRLSALEVLLSQDHDLTQRLQSILDQIAQARVDRKITVEPARPADAAQNPGGGLLATIRTDLRLETMEGDAQALRRSRDTIRSEIDRIKASLGLERSEAVFVARASAPVKPVFPKRTTMAAAGGVVGGGLLAVFIGVMALVRKRIETPHDAAKFERLARLPVIGSVPDTGGKQSGQGTTPPAMMQELTRVAGLLELGGRSQAVVVAGLMPGDGGHTIALGLARASARSGLPTLLVDLDDRNLVALQFGATGETSLADCVESGSDIVSALHPTSEDALFVMPHGGSSPGFGNPAALAVAESIERLKAMFAVVIIAAPSIVPTPRGALANRRADRLLLVIPPALRRAEMIGRWLNWAGPRRPAATAVLFNKSGWSYAGLDD